MKFRFPIVIIDGDFRSENASALAFVRWRQSGKAEGMEVLRDQLRRSFQFCAATKPCVGIHPVDR